MDARSNQLASARREKSDRPAPFSGAGRAIHVAEFVRIRLARSLAAAGGGRTAEPALEPLLEPPLQQAGLAGRGARRGRAGRLLAADPPLLVAHLVLLA